MLALYATAWRRDTSFLVAIAWFNQDWLDGCSDSSCCLLRSLLLYPSLAFVMILIPASTTIRKHLRVSLFLHSMKSPSSRPCPQANRHRSIAIHILSATRTCKLSIPTIPCLHESPVSKHPQPSLNSPVHVLAPTTEQKKIQISTHRTLGAQQSQPSKSTTQIPHEITTEIKPT